MTTRPAAQPEPAPTPALRLRALATGRAVVRAPGVYDALSARVAAEAGFAALYASGGSVVRSFGLPDLGLADPTMMAARYRQIAEAAPLPVLADGDNGFGKALNVHRVVRLYEQAGVAGLHLEDQASPKRCGHYAGIDLVSAAEMAGKVRAALDARRDPGTIIVARTDAFASQGLQAAIDRAGAYAEAGADIVFVEGIRAAGDLRAVGTAVALPKVLNCGPPGVAPALDDAALAALGFTLLIYPADLQCAALAAMGDCLAALKAQGTGPVPPAGATLAARDRLVDLDAWMKIGAEAAA